MSKSILDAASRADLVINTKAGRAFPFVFEDENGDAVDFTGSTFRLQVKAWNGNAATGSALLTLTTGDGIEGDVADGECQPVFPPAADEGLAVGQYVYDIMRLESGEPVETVQVGLIDAVDGVTEEA
jgi:hypothetical protein